MPDLAITNTLIQHQLGYEYRQLGKEAGIFRRKAYLLYEDDRFKIIRLNFLQRVLRYFFIAYRKTHLKYVAKELANFENIPDKLIYRMYMHWIKTYPDIKNPLTRPAVRNYYIGRESRLDFLANSYEEHPEMARKLIALSAEYNYRPISGDGHCMFRSIAAGIILEILNRKEDIIDQFYQQVADIIKTLPESAELLSAMQRFKDILYPLKAEHAPRMLEEIIRSKASSDDLVKFLRILACNYSAAHLQDFMADKGEDYSVKTQEEYFRDMKNMSLGEFGTNLELHALAMALNVQIQLLHVDDMVGYDLKGPNYLFKPNNPFLKLVLLYRTKPKHYDLVIRRSA